MALAAIEVYNKPNFHQREQVFTVLIVNAWEALLKAKLLQDANNKMSTLYVKEGSRYKRTRSGRPITIDVRVAAQRCSLPNVVMTNLDHLVETRNAATHLTAQSEFLPLLVFSLGSASLKNFAELARQWFGSTLSEYNLFIMPLGFVYPFRSATVVEIRSEPADIATILKAVAEDQEKGLDEDGFSLICEIKTSLVSAKKLTTEAHLTASVDPADPTAAIIKRMKLTDQYPLSHTEAWLEIRKSLPDFPRNRMIEIIRMHKVKDNPTYAAYNYASRTLEARGPTPTTPVIYNADFVSFCVGLGKSRLSDGS